MKRYLSLLLSAALILGASSLAFARTHGSSSGHRSHSTSHHRSRSGNSGSKTHSNIPGN